MKGFRQPKEPSKAELKKLVIWLKAQVELYKKIAMRMRNCESLDELKELREAMKTAKESVIFAEKTKDGKLIDPTTWEELLTNQEYEENAETINEEVEDVQN